MADRAAAWGVPPMPPIRAAISQWDPRGIFEARLGEGERFARTGFNTLLKPLERRLIWEVAEVTGSEVPQAGRRRVGRSAGLRDAAGGGVLGMHWALWFGGCLLRVAARCLAPICVQYE